MGYRTLWEGKQRNWFMSDSVLLDELTLMRLGCLHGKL